MEECTKGKSCLRRRDPDRENPSGEKVATDVRERKGKFLAADGGTLFLDELEAFPMNLQAKVLRAVEEKACTEEGRSAGRHDPGKSGKEFFRLS
jgi:hypothetical protein